jgi:hypothetical protein
MSGRLFSIPVPPSGVKDTRPRERLVFRREVLLVSAMAMALLTARAASPATPGKLCSPAQTTALINRFVTAFNAGDRRALNNTIWSGKLYFKWYTVLAEPGFRSQPEASRRDTLMDYFAARHAAGEHLTMTNVKINGRDIGNRGFEFHLLRSAHDLQGGQVPYDGKATSSCMNGRLTMWLMNATP